MSVADHRESARCGFCGKGPSEVTRLIAGLTSWICDSCVEVCHDILAGLEPAADAPGPANADAPGPSDASEPAHRPEPTAPNQPVAPTADPTPTPDPTPDPDPIMADLVKAQTLAVHGDRIGARQRFTGLWDQVGPTGDPLHRVSIAHYLADLQDDVHDELAWDLRALEAADALTDDRAQAYHGSLDVAAFYPSLHLNLGDDYARIGRRDDALHHLDRAEACLDALPDDGYGGMIRRGVAALRQRLTEPDTLL